MDLASVWNAAHAEGLASAVTAASEVIDQVLAVDPLGSSESRAGETRVFFAPPLTVYFFIDEHKQIVHLEQLRFHRMSR